MEITLQKNIILANWFSKSWESHLECSVVTKSWNKPIKSQNPWLERFLDWTLASCEGGGPWAPVNLMVFFCMIFGWRLMDLFWLEFMGSNLLGSARTPSLSASPQVAPFLYYSLFTLIQFSFQILASNSNLSHGYDGKVVIRRCFFWEESKDR